MAPGQMPGTQADPAALLPLLRVGAFVVTLLSPPLPQVDRAAAEARGWGDEGVGGVKASSFACSSCSQ